MNHLEIKNLSLGFQDAGQVRLVLKGLNLKIQKGSFTALVGESGSGKTLTALSILKLLPSLASIQSGEILFSEENQIVDLLQCTDEQNQQIRGQKIAMIFQDPALALNPVMQIGEQILETIVSKKKIDRKIAQNEVCDLLKKVGLNDEQLRYKQYPHELSGGQRQRVMVAMALALKPQILIADEPTTALDVTIQMQILELIRSLQKEYNLTVLFVTHDLSIVAHYADHVYVMKEGQVVESGSVSKVLTEPQHEYTQILLSALPDKWRHLSLSTTDQNQNKRVVFELKNVNKSYVIKRKRFWRPESRIQVLRDVSFQVYENETLGIVGESGSGKSTLAKLILKLEECQSGEIVFDGKPITKLTEKRMRMWRSRLQMIFQDPVASLNPKMTIDRLLQEPLKVHTQMSKREREQKIRDVLIDVGLSEKHLRSKPHELSGGQCQRVAIARALLLEPKLLIADEATSSLDVTIQKQILDLLKTLQKKYGMTLIVISHNLEMVQKFCDRVMVMYLGKMMELMPAQDLSLAQHPYTQSLWQHSLSSNPLKKNQVRLLPGEAPSLLNLPTGCVFQTRCPYFVDACDQIEPELKSLPQNPQHVLACHVPQNKANP